MTRLETKAFLDRLDRERKAMGTPSEAGIRTDFSHDRTGCAVVYGSCSVGRIDAVIRKEVARADAQGYAIDWKVYGHDQPNDLRERLMAAGFEPEPEEQVLVLALDPDALVQFPESAVVVEQVVGRTGLDDVAEISREIGRTHVEQEREGFARLMATRPDHMTIFIARVDDVPAACGRIYFYDAGGFAELCGGRTKTTFRNRGLYLAIVRARLAEALRRGYSYVPVDALPTSEPLLRKRGFEQVTWTQPLVYRPAKASSIDP
ncbi:MAG: GNAT family N-acetyltransferase [Myxococcota bacterium]